MAEGSNIVGLKYVAEGLDSVLAGARQYRDALQGLEQTSQRTATRTTQAGREAETAWSLAMQKYAEETRRATKAAETAWSVAMQKAASETQKAASAIDTAWSLAMQRSAAETQRAANATETAWSLAMQRSAAETKRAADAAETAWSLAMQRSAAETQRAANATETAWSLAMQRSAAETKRAADAAEAAWSLAMQRSAAETKRAADAAETAWSLAMQRVAEETRRAAAVVAASTAYNQLRASMDSAVSASQRYAAAQQVVRDAHAQGVITTRQMNAALKQMEQSFEAARLQRYAEAQRKISRELINGNAAVNRINAAYQQMSEKVRAGTLTAQQHADAQRALARELAATNGYLTRSGALNTQKALAELRAAQATRDATAADAAAAAAKAKLTASYQQLLASVNPTIARQQQTKQVVDMLRAAVNAQAITVQQAAQALLQYRASLNALNGGLNQASLGLNRTGVIVQQAGYQFGDFFVQVQSGTNVMVALGQQATQLIGTFAAFATSVRTVAILSALGVVVPILTAIGAYMIRTSGSAKTLEQRINDLTSSSDRLKDTLETITGDDMDLAVKFGDMATAIRDSADAMRELDRASELKNLVSVVEGFGKAVQPGFLDYALDPATAASLLGFGAFTGGATAALRAQQEESFSAKTGFQMGLDAYEAYIEGMRAAAVRGDVPELNRVFQQFIADATDGGTAVDKITLAGGALAAEMMRVNTLIAESNARYNGTAESAKRVLNFEQERARLMERDLGAAQEIQLAQAAAKFGKDSLRYRQEERAVARQSYAEQLNAQVQQNKLTVDQANDLLSIYDATQSIVEAEDRRVDALERVAAAQRQYATSRATGEDAVRAEEEAFRRVVAAQQGYQRSRVLGEQEVARAAEAALNRIVVAQQGYQRSRVLGAQEVAREEELGQQRVLAAQLQYQRVRLMGDQAQTDAANRLTSSLEAQLRLQQAINVYGEDSAEVLAIQREQHEAMARAQAASLGLTGAAADEAVRLSLALFDAENATGGVASGMDSIAARANAAAQAAFGIYQALQMSLRSLAAQEAGIAAAQRVVARGGSETDARVTQAAATEEARLRALGVEGAELTAGTAMAAEVERRKIAAQAAEKALFAGFSAGGGGGGGGGRAAVDEQAEAFERLRRSIDDTYRAQQMFTEGKAILDAQFADKNSAEYLRLLDLLKQKYPEVAGAANDFGNQLQQISNVMSRSMEDAFMSIIDGSQSAGEAFKGMARTIIAEVVKIMVIRPLVRGILGIFGLSANADGGVFSGGSRMAFANGGAFYNGNVTPFADGGVVSSPTLFPMRNGTGLMGEAGPEAIMPLKRTSSGKLGVVAEGGSGTVNQTLVFNIAANGDESVRRIVRDESPRIAEQAKAAVLDAKRRGGAYGRAF